MTASSAIAAATLPPQQQEPSIHLAVWCTPARSRGRPVHMGTRASSRVPCASAPRLVAVEPEVKVPRLEPLGHSECVYRGPPEVDDPHEHHQQQAQQGIGLVVVGQQEVQQGEDAKPAQGGEEARAELVVLPGLHDRGNRRRVGALWQTGTGGALPCCAEAQTQHAALAWNCGAMHTNIETSPRPPVMLR